MIHARIHRRSRPPGQQRGATLLIGLIMLALLTLHALASFSSSTTQLRIAANMQERQHAQAAANLAIAQVLSSDTFVGGAQAVAATPIEVDIDGDGRLDYRVSVKPVCTAVRPLRSVDLDPAVPEDLQCLGGTAFGPVPLCALTSWDLQASVVNAAGAANTGVTARISQGATVRIGAGEATAHCGES